MVVLADALHVGKANPYSEHLSIPVRTNSCHFQSSVINLPPGSWLPQEMVPYQEFSVSLGCWLDNQQWTQPGRSWKVGVFVAEPIYNLHPWKRGHFLHKSQLSNDRDGWGKRVTDIHRTGRPIHLIIKIFLCWGHPLVSIHVEHKYLPFFVHSQRAICILPCQISLSPIFQSCSSQVPKY